MRCTNCGARVFDLARQDEVVAVRGRSYTLPDVERCRCRACGDEVFTGEQSARFGEQLAGMRRREEGLLAPAEIRAIRERLQLSQQRLSELLGVGDKTVARWECDMIIQNRTADDLLRLLDRQPETAYVLAEARLGIPAPRYDADKAAAAIAWLLRRVGQVGLVALARLLCWADFMSYYRRGRPITGATYDVGAGGPVPREVTRALLEAAEGHAGLPFRVQLKKRPGGDGQVLHLTPQASRVDAAGLDEDEVAILEEAAQRWQDHGLTETDSLLQLLPGAELARERVVIYPVMAVPIPARFEPADDPRQAADAVAAGRRARKRVQQRRRPGAAQTG